MSDLGDGPPHPASLVDNRRPPWRAADGQLDKDACRPSATEDCRRPPWLPETDVRAPPTRTRPPWYPLDLRPGPLANTVGGWDALGEDASADSRYTGAGFATFAKVEPDWTTTGVTLLRQAPRGHGPLAPGLLELAPQLAVCVTEKANRKRSLPKGGRGPADEDWLQHTGLWEFVEETGIDPVRVVPLPGQNAAGWVLQESRKSSRYHTRYYVAICRGSWAEEAIGEQILAATNASFGALLSWKPPEDPTDADPVVLTHWVRLDKALGGVFSMTGREALLWRAVALFFHLRGPAALGLSVPTREASTPRPAILHTPTVPLSLESGVVRSALDLAAVRAVRFLEGGTVWSGLHGPTATRRWPGFGAAIRSLGRSRGDPLFRGIELETLCEVLRQQAPAWLDEGARTMETMDARVLLLGGAIRDRVRRILSRRWHVEGYMSCAARAAETHYRQTGRPLESLARLWVRVVGSGRRGRPNLGLGATPRQMGLLDLPVMLEGRLNFAARENADTRWAAVFSPGAVAHWTCEPLPRDAQRVSLPEAFDRCWMDEMGFRNEGH